MPQFKIYGERDGKPMKGMVNADDPGHAKAIATDKGISVLRVKRIVAEPASVTAVATPVETAVAAPEPVRAQHVEAVPVYQQPSPQPQSVPQTVVQVNQNNMGPKPSQALPALVNIFVPPVGQLIQGRITAAILWVILFVVGFASVFVLIGVLIVPALWIACIIDAAKYDPR